MPNLTIAINDQSWPNIVAILIARLGPPDEGVQPRAWVEQIAAQAFADVVAAAAETPPPAPSKSAIRPSRVRT